MTGLIFTLTPFDGLQKDIVALCCAEACKSRCCGHVYVVKWCYQELYYLGLKGPVMCPAPGPALICSASVLCFSYFWLVTVMKVLMCIFIFTMH